MKVKVKGQRSKQKVIWNHQIIFSWWMSKLDDNILFFEQILTTSADPLYVTRFSLKFCIFPLKILLVLTTINQWLMISAKKSLCLPLFTWNQFQPYKTLFGQRALVSYYTFGPNFWIWTKFLNLDKTSEFWKISKCWPIFRILTKFLNFNQISEFQPNF